jgi:cell division protein ZapA
MQQIEVVILGQSYRLACPAGGEASLRAAVTAVDHEMSAIRDAGKVKARERIAVLAALNLAYQLSERATAVPPSAPDAAPVQAGAELDKAELDALLKQLDDALQADGHLL